MAGFTFRLMNPDGTPADPPSFRAAVPTWRPGDTIHLPRRTLRITEVRPASDPGDDPVLVVEEA